MSKFIYKSALELAKLIREGSATSVEIVKEHLEQIHKHNGQINALISVFEEEALAEAAACDTEAKAGNFRGPLHGVPITIKEQFWIKGKASNTNSKILKDFVAPSDAVVIERIKKAGCIILGQSNVPRNLTDYQVHGDIYPVGKNPFNPEYSPGGSTGGGAASLAAGFSPLELGGDFGGSIRVPANFCGLYGLKPTENTVPLHGNIPLAKNSNTFLVHMAQAGPMARNMYDLESLWKVIAGPHESDRNIADIKWEHPKDKPLNAYRVAWTDSWPGYGCSSAIRNAIESLIKGLQSDGCNTTKDIPKNDLHKRSLQTYMGIFPYVIAQSTPWIVREIIKMQLNSGVFKGLKNDAPEFAREMNKAFKMNVHHYASMMLQRSLITQEWELFFKDYDFMICPVAFGPSYKRCKTGSKIQYDGKEMVYLNYVWPYVACFNASGNPTLSIPLGIGPDGLPLGIQIVGKYWSEPELIAFGKKVASITSGFIKPEGY